MDAAAASFVKEDTSPLRLYFQDKARLSRMQNPVKCWAPEGFRPSVKLQRVREYTHVYSAVCPIDGYSFSLILPVCKYGYDVHLFTGVFRVFTELPNRDGDGWCSMA